MRSKKYIWAALFAALGMLVLILDSKTAFDGASQGMELCIRTVIPSLFPFFILSIYITGTLTGHPVRALRPLCAICGVPKGGEAMLAVGLLGGYPVGAQSICQAYKSNQLSKEDAHRLLGFCSNAGPAFIFGITGSLFTSPVCPWLLWGIHILSALVVGTVLPNKRSYTISNSSATKTTVPNALKKAVHVTAGVCGWVVLFRILLAFFRRWFLWLLAQTPQAIVVGLLELVNGCQSLFTIKEEGLRFILCACFLAFGGICVGMQTLSVTEEVGSGMYFPGKLLQTVVSFLLACPIQFVLFSAENKANGMLPYMLTVLVIFTAVVIYLHNIKKTVAFKRQLVYNK